MATEVEMVRRYEDTLARRLRASCEHCGHSWRPRNGSTKVNRCPGCSIRGRVNYMWLKDKTEEQEAAERAEVDRQDAEARAAADRRPDEAVG